MFKSQSDFSSRFSRGELPYSLHAKTFYIRMKDGSAKVAITSSNLAVRDAIKNEIMVIADCSDQEKENSQVFFNELIKNSETLLKFKEDAGEVRVANVPRTPLPRVIYNMDFNPNSNNTVTIVCDNGWTVSLRIHNASSKVEPSLKFDVNLKGVPQDLFSHDEPWGN